MEEKKGIHYGWFIFAGICVLSAMVLGTTVNISSVFMLPVSTAMGVSRGAMATWMTFQGISMAIANPIWGNLIHTKNLRVCMTVGALLVLAGLIIFSLAPNIQVFYVGGVCIGCGMPPLTAMIQATLSSKWFAPKVRGKLLGICSAFSAFGTFVWAPVFAAVMEATGDYHTAYYIAAGAFAITVLPVCLFVVRKEPAEKGLQPLGYDPNDTNDGGNEAMKYGVDAKVALASVTFWAIFIIFGLLAFGQGFNSSQSAIAKELLAGTSLEETAAIIGATMVSTAAVSNLLSKIVIGWMVDRGLLKHAIILFDVIFFLTFIFWTFMPNVYGLYIGAFCLGTHNGLIQVGVPLVIRQSFGPRDYDKVLSYLLIPKTAMGGVMTMIVNMFYDFMGTYQGVIYIGMVAVAIIIVLSFVSFKGIGKYEWTDAEGKPAPAEFAAAA